MSATGTRDDARGPRLTLRPNGYDWRFLPVLGQTYSDAGSQACHGTPPT